MVLLLLRILGTGKGNSVSHQPLLAGSGSSSVLSAAWAGEVWSTAAVARPRPMLRQADRRLDCSEAWHVMSLLGLGRGERTPPALLLVVAVAATAWMAWKLER